MEIVKKGKLPTFIYRGECNDCGCIIQLNENEYFSCYNVSRSEYIFNCPTKGCERNIVIRRIREK